MNLLMTFRALAIRQSNVIVVIVIVVVVVVVVVVDDDDDDRRAIQLVRKNSRKMFFN